MTSSIYLIGDTSASTDDIPALLSESQLQTLILEAGNIALDVNDLDTDGQTDDYVVINPQYTSTEILDLINDTVDGETRTALAYVNVAVTDHNRFYWDQAWVTDPIDENNPDVGTIVDTAPAWLRDNLGGAVTGELRNGNPNDPILFGYIVDYDDSDWQDIVIDQAIAYVEHGYNGIFLDDVGRYFQADLGTPVAAENMMQFIIDLEEAVIAATDHTRESLHITINSDAFIINNYFFDDNGALNPAANESLADEFRAVVDSLVTENVTAANPGIWGIANFWFNQENAAASPNGDTSTDLIAIEVPQDWVTMQDILTALAAEDVSLFLARDASYTDVLNSPQIGTAGNDALTGSDLAEAIFGRGGADTIEGGAGDDIIYGGALGSTIHGGDGDDLIYGGPGDDLIFAGDGDDTIYGGGGNDTIIGGAGSDAIYGEAGNDLISGGAAGDLLSGGAGADAIYGGDLPDTFMFDF